MCLVLYILPSKSHRMCWEVRPLLYDVTEEHIEAAFFFFSKQANESSLALQQSGFSSTFKGSRGQTEALWRNLPLHMPSAFQRDNSSIVHVAFVPLSSGWQCACQSWGAASSYVEQFNWLIVVFSLRNAWSGYTHTGALMNRYANVSFENKKLFYS